MQPRGLESKLGGIEKRGAAMQFCSSCGSRLAGDSPKFCSSCGAALPGSDLNPKSESFDVYELRPPSRFSAEVDFEDWDDYFGVVTLMMPNAGADELFFTGLQAIDSQDLLLADRVLRAAAQRGSWRAMMSLTWLADHRASIADPTVIDLAELDAEALRWGKRALFYLTDERNEIDDPSAASQAIADALQVVEIAIQNGAPDVDLSDVGAGATSHYCPQCGRILVPNSRIGKTCEDNEHQLIPNFNRWWLRHSTEDFEIRGNPNYFFVYAKDVFAVSSWIIMGHAQDLRDENVKGYDTALRLAALRWNPEAMFALSQRAMAMGFPDEALRWERRLLVLAERLDSNEIKSLARDLQQRGIDSSVGLKSEDLIDDLGPKIGAWYCLECGRRGPQGPDGVWELCGHPVGEFIG